MTVKDLIIQNPGLTLHLMTPAGYVYVAPEQAKNLLDGGSLISHPGCSGCDIELSANEVLSQHLQRICMNKEKHQCYLLI